MDLIFIGRYNKDEILDGPEKVAKRIFENYTSKNSSVFFEYFFDGEKYNIFKKLFGKELVETVNGSEVWRFGIIRLYFMLIKLTPKVIHLVSFERFALVASLYKLSEEIKIIYNVHGLVIHENKYLEKIKRFKDSKDKFAEKIFIKYSDILLMLSKDFEKLSKEYYKFDEKKIRCVMNGIDEEFAIAGRARQTLGNHNLKVVFIADIERKEKGFSFLKDTLESLNFEIELYIIGKRTSNSEEFFKNNLIKVFFLDKLRTKELAEFLKDKDIFISSSDYESFGTTTIECMAAGVIPVVTSETGASEVIKNRKNGFIYDYNDGERLRNILELLNNSIELRENLSLEARHIYENLNWDKITEEYINIYKSLL